METAALVTLPWLLVFPSLGLSDQRQVTYLRTGWITLGSLLWLGPPPPQPSPTTAFLGLPSSPSVSANNRIASGSCPFGGVPSLPWNDMWLSLSPLHTTTITAHCLSSPSPYRLPGPLHPDLMDGRTTAESWLPLTGDSDPSAFPWHLLTVSGNPLLSATPRSIRRALSPTTPRSPAWTFPHPAPPSFWLRVWSELEDSPLHLDMRSTCLLVLGRNLWTYRPKPPLSPHCPVGCASADSPTHGIVACPEATRVWQQCLPLLRAMGVLSPLVFDAHGIVGAWQAVPSLRSRLVLWRNAVLVTLHTARTLAGRDARTASCAPDFNHCTRLDVLSFTTSSVVSALSAAWDRLPQDSPAAIARFRGRWILGSHLLRLGGPLLRVLPLPSSNLPSPPAP